MSYQILILLVYLINAIQYTKNNLMESRNVEQFSLENSWVSLGSYQLTFDRVNFKFQNLLWSNFKMRNHLQLKALNLDGLIPVNVDQVSDLSVFFSKVCFLPSKFYDKVLYPLNFLSSPQFHYIYQWMTKETSLPV